MKETLQDLKTRRSCRKYRPEQIKDEELEAIWRQVPMHRPVWESRAR